MLAKICSSCGEVHHFKILANNKRIRCSGCGHIGPMLAGYKLLYEANKPDDEYIDFTKTFRKLKENKPKKLKFY